MAWQARKPDSVLCGHLSGKRVAAPLKRSTRGPGEQPESTLLFDLAPGGVYLADVSPRLRCALTAPFHPCQQTLQAGPELKSFRALASRQAGGLLSVALACGFPRLGVTQHPALWCPDFPPRRFIPQGHDGCGASSCPWSKAFPGGILTPQKRGAEKRRGGRSACNLILSTTRRKCLKIAKCPSLFSRKKYDISHQLK